MVGSWPFVLLVLGSWGAGDAGGVVVVQLGKAIEMDLSIKVY